MLNSGWSMEGVSRADCSLVQTPTALRSAPYAQMQLGSCRMMGKKYFLLVEPAIGRLGGITAYGGKLDLDDVHFARPQVLHSIESLSLLHSIHHHQLVSFTLSVCHASLLSPPLPLHTLVMIPSRTLRRATCRVEAVSSSLSSVSSAPTLPTAQPASTHDHGYRSLLVQNSNLGP